MNSSEASVSGTRSGLFSKVSLLLSASLGLSALGTYMGRDIQSGGLFIGLLVAFIAGAIAVPFMAKRSRNLGLVGLTAWVFVSGLFLGPAINAYSELLGWQTVFLAYIGTGGVMAVCGAIGALSGKDFSGMGRVLMIGLFALIAVGFVNIFMGFSDGVNIVYSLAGMAIFAGFFIFDFFRLSKEEDNWFNAITLTMSIYLDFINFLLFLLRLLAATRGGSSSKR